MNIEAYLDRINYRGSLEPTAQTLRDLQVAHLLTVPFENLSIHSNEPIVLDDDSLFDKIVNRCRGGFCYELNGLFAALLRALGFKVEMLSAGVANSEGVFGPDFDHMVLLVTLEDRWLVDVGFGDSYREPLLLDYQGEQVQDDGTYRITSHNSYLIMSQRRGESEWKDQYRFTLQPHIYSDYAEMCHYHQTSPQSHFTRGRVCTRATPDGRITLSELRLITTVNGQREERMLGNDEEYRQVLRETFGILMS
ncbi:MAG TPA: arylamine N-acetyltransferase [Pyrinomonadaceae bacterium]|nr:arylamine N-acetyltransferase [Pyrinomonadaceae bacterium]